MATDKKGFIKYLKLYLINYKNIFDLNGLLTVISKMLRKFVAFIVTNHLPIINLTCHLLTTFKKKTLATIFKTAVCKDICI